MSWFLNWLQRAHLDLTSELADFSSTLEAGYKLTVAITNIALECISFTKNRDPHICRVTTD